MILDLSEQGMSMQTAVPLETNRRLDLRLMFSDPSASVETTGYVAWADALGRAGVRLGELPEESRQRLRQWLTLNDNAPSRKAPTLSLVRPLSKPGDRGVRNEPPIVTISLEEAESLDNSSGQASTTVQYEFASLGSDLNAALHRISERALSITRGGGAAIALGHPGPMTCRASVGTGAPPVGTHLDVSSGFSGECIRSGKALRCDDADVDPRVDPESCRLLHIRSIIAAPIQYQRDVVGLLAVISASPFAFDEGDIAVVERLARTVLLTLSQAGNR